MKPSEGRSEKHRVEQAFGGRTRTLEFTSASGRTRSYRTAAIKQPLESEIRVESDGLVEDEQADAKHHGGPDRALVAYPLPHYEAWRDRYPDKELVVPTFGENLSVSAIESDVCLGDVYELGSAVVQICQPREPCRTPQRVWKLPKLAILMKELGMTGWCIRVLEPGSFSAPADMNLIERPHPEATIEVLNNLVVDLDAEIPDGVKELENCGCIAAAWKIR